MAQLFLLAFAYFVVWKSQHPIGQSEVLLCIVVAAFAAAIGAVPFILDYRVVLRLMEINALGSVAEQIQNLEALSSKIHAATNEWTTAQAQAEKTSAASREIADRMTSEVREFAGFMQKMNDSEKATLRLEVEKLHRGEGEWLQVLVRIFDHIFALHAAAVRSGDAKFSNPIGDFQNACRGTVRRIGLTPFVAEPDEPFDPEKHQVAGSKTKPPADAIVVETVAAGYTFQGRFLRHALVRIGEPKKSAPIPVAAGTPTISVPDPLETSETDQDQLTLGSDE